MKIMVKDYTHKRNLSFTKYIYTFFSSFFFFFFIEFQTMVSVFYDCALYHQTKTSIGFWCRQGLSPKSLIQPSETLLVKLIRTHYKN